MKPVQSLALLTLVPLVVSINAQEPVEILPGSVNDIMVSIITPATDTIWGIENPQTDEEWQVYIDAAAELIDAAARIKTGGAGPKDSTWANDAEWQRFADMLIESGKQVSAAAAARNLDALIEVSNDMMYPPCEECHIMFHPGLQEQDVN